MSIDTNAAAPSAAAALFSSIIGASSSVPPSSPQGASGRADVDAQFSSLIAQLTGAAVVDADTGAPADGQPTLSKGLQAGGASTCRGAKSKGQRPSRNAAAASEAAGAPKGAAAPAGGGAAATTAARASTSTGEDSADADAAGDSACDDAAAISTAATPPSVPVDPINPINPIDPVNQTTPAWLLALGAQAAQRVAASADAEAASSDTSTSIDGAAREHRDGPAPFSTRRQHHKTATEAIRTPANERSAAPVAANAANATPNPESDTMTRVVADAKALASPLAPDSIDVAPVNAGWPQTAPAAGAPAGTPRAVPPAQTKTDVALARGAIAQAASPVSDSLGLPQAPGPVAPRQLTTFAQAVESTMTAGAKNTARDAGSNDDMPNNAKDTRSGRSLTEWFADRISKSDDAPAPAAKSGDVAAAVVPGQTPAASALGRAIDVAIAPVVTAAGTLSAPAPLAAAQVATPDGPSMIPESADVRGQLVQAIKLQWNDGAGDVRLTLRPDYLGDVSISLRVEQNGGVTAHVNAEAPEVRAWISANEPILRQGLAEQGLTLDRLVVAQTKEEAASNGEERRRQAPQQEEPRQKRREDAVFEVIV